MASFAVLQVRAEAAKARPLSPAAGRRPGQAFDPVGGAWLLKAVDPGDGPLDPRSPHGLGELASPDPGGRGGRNGRGPTNEVRAAAAGGRFVNACEALTDLPVAFRCVTDDEFVQPRHGGFCTLTRPRREGVDNQVRSLLNGDVSFLSRGKLGDDPRPVDWGLTFADCDATIKKKPKKNC